MNRILSKKLTAIKKLMLKRKSFEKLQAEITPALSGMEKPLYAAFLSVCNKKERAKVFRCAASTLAEAWEGVCADADKYISTKDLEPHWVKADIMCRSERASLSDVIDTIAKGYNEFFRRGIAFDDELKTALIEAEINGSRVISYKKHTIELTVVNKHLSKTCEKTLSELPESVLLFDCISAFCDEDNNAYPLYSNGPETGRRDTGGIDKKTTLDIIMTSSEFLSMMIHEDGRFDYGFYPVFHREISGYNILRHASSIWSLLCAYRLTGDRFTLMQAEKAIAFMVNNTYNKYNLPPSKENTVYLAELHSNEIKIGGNGVAIIMLTEYMDIIGDRRLEKLCKELGNGILELLNEKGELFHVLNFPKLTPKEQFRTVYYDGECLFALCRLYGLTKEKRWLEAAEKIADRFIREDYTQYADHWASYGINELTKYSPREKYFEFGLKNVQNNTKKIRNRKTTYHTFLELLCVAFELYLRITDGNIKVSYLEKFDAKTFVDTVFKRADRMLDGYAYPEYVMYFKYPEQALGAFFVRHDGYRIRIDDIQHFCGAYYSFYRNYDRLCEIRSALESNK